MKDHSTTNLGKDGSERYFRLLQDSLIKHTPLTGAFELTARCSLRCKMCYIRLDSAQISNIGRELTSYEWISLGREAARAGTLTLQLTGGEPLIREDFEEIYTALILMGFQISLCTNATLMTSELQNLLNKYPPTEILITIYGASPETYHKVCGEAKGFEKTIRGIELLLNVPTRIVFRTTFI